jgi:hypothetical protein
MLGKKKKKKLKTDMDILYGPTHKELNKNVNSATALLQSL